MSRLLTDTEIDAFLSEVKPLPSKWKEKLRPKPKAKAGHAGASIRTTGDRGHEFVVFVRENSHRTDDFSIGLQVELDGKLYVLVRFNGSSHRHTNVVEREQGFKSCSFRSSCHIHLAKEAYQRAGYRIDGFAEPTSKFHSLNSALDVFFNSFGFVAEGGDNNKQNRLPFEFGGDE